MSEHSSHEATSPITYRAVLDSLPPDHLLRPHVEPWADQEKRAAAALSPPAETFFPTDEQVERVIRDSLRAIEGEGRHETEDVPHRPSYMHAMDVLLKMSSEQLKSRYFTRSEQPNDLQTLIGAAQSTDELHFAFDLVRHIYDRADILDLLDPSGEAYAHQDAVFQSLLKKEESEGALAIFLSRESALWPEGALPLDITKAKRDWSDRYLEHVAKLPKQLRDELLFNTYSRTSNQTTGQVSIEHLQWLLGRAGSHARLLGVETLTVLREKAKIIDLDYYTTDELQLMREVIDGDPDTIKRLQDGDITVMYTDARSYNDAYRYPLRAAQTPGYTLNFQTHDPGDFAETQALMIERGLAASTVIYLAHSNPGRMKFGIGTPGSFAVTSKTPESDQSDKLMPEVSLSVLGVTQDARWMQDSRGIVDHESRIGRRAAVFIACNQATVPEHEKSLPQKRSWWKLWRRRESSSQTQLQPSAESTIVAFARQADDPSLDVYGPSAPVRPKRTERGLRYVSKEDGHLPAAHVTIDQFGNVKERRVDEIILRQPAMTEKAA